MSGRTDRSSSGRSSRKSNASGKEPAADDLIKSGTPIKWEEVQSAESKRSGVSSARTSDGSGRSKEGSARREVDVAELARNRLTNESVSKISRSSRRSSAKSSARLNSSREDITSTRAVDLKDEPEYMGSVLGSVISGRETSSRIGSAQRHTSAGIRAGSWVAGDDIVSAMDTPAGSTPIESERAFKPIGTSQVESGRDSKLAGTSQVESGRDSKHAGISPVESGRDSKHAGISPVESGRDSKPAETRSIESGKGSKPAGTSPGRGRLEGGDSRPSLLSENTGDLYHIDDGGIDLEDSDYDDGDLNDIPSNAAADGRDDDDNDDDDLGGGDEEGISEVIVLDPDHRLMGRFQARLAEHLEQQSYKYTLEVRELSEALKTGRKEREDVGVELYGVQQELAKYQSMLEKLHDDYSRAQRGRQESEQQLIDTRAAQQRQQQLLDDTRKAANSLQAEVDMINQRLYYLSSNKEKNSGEMALLRRAAEKSKNENKKLEVEKRMQDLYVDRLVEREDRLRQDIAMYDAQVAAQERETKEARDALTEANMEIEMIHVEKRQLFQQWSSSVVGMRRRDEAHAVLQSALHESEQRLQTLHTELNAFKKSTQLEQEENEKLMSTLSKVESDIESVRRQLAASRSEHEALKQEFSTLTRILTETEDCYGRVTIEKSQCSGQLEQLKRDIERQYLEKVRLEDDILDRAQEKLTAQKGSQYTQKLVKKTRERTRDLETQLVVAENDIAKIMLSTAHLESRIDGQVKVRKELEGEVKKLDESIARQQTEISKRELVIERKQNVLDVLSKRLNSMVDVAGGQEVAPLELSIKSLQKSIDEESQRIVELQQSWLRDQAELVELCKCQDDRSIEVEDIKQQISVLSQKRLRQEREVERERREVMEVQRHIQAMHTDRVKLDTLVLRERGNETSLRDENILTENKYLGDLRAAEKVSIELEGRLEALREEKCRLVNSLVEAERQIMMWERKTEIARETHAAIDADIGHGEIYQMRAEIHRMQVRLNQLTKQQEKLIVEMERSVSYRDTIATRGEAASKSGLKGGKGAPSTRNVHQRAVASLHRTIQQKNAEMTTCDSELAQLRERQREVSEEIGRRQSNVRAAAESSAATETELDKITDTRGRGLLELVANQRRAKYYEQLRDGRYKRICKGSKEDLELELRKQNDRAQMVTAIVERLANEYQGAEGDLKRAVSVYGSKIRRVQLT